MSICFSLLIIGLFLESISMLLLMMMPVLLPTIQLMGIDIIWFAILFVMMIECALVTPPVGLNLFTIQAVTGSPIIDITKGVTPFFILILLAVLIIYLLPEIALFIPYHYTG
ncbi:TRAP transporter large permease subunit [Moritella sp. 28]|uniref:TRAP transporter large permease subunit n=1 Tax=Moritella sp. 28 TaxID=2746232 RepID=UPI0021021BB9|nr:TRAP transporter large permease subunit [Moritella sp. 28]